MVIKGPDATAGSTPNFLNAIGITVPETLEISIAKSNATPMQADTAKPKPGVMPFAKITYRPINTKDRTPRINPLHKPTLASLSTRPSFCLPSRFSSISTRIVTARDWVPTFPAISRTRDWKQMTMVSWATTPSNSPTTLETTRPRPSRMISQGRRFFTLWRIGSFNSSSEARPASFA